MKLSMICALSLVTCVTFAQLPFETEAHRKPSFQTGGSVLIKGGRVLTVTKGTLESGDILVRNGKIVQIAPNINPPPNVKVVDAKGKVVMPGIVDAHIHRGILSTNEGSDSIVAEVRMGDVLSPSAKSVWQALAGGETSGLALHGSANAVGGQSQVVKLKYRRPIEEYVVADAPRMVKFALGENVTRSGSSSSSRFPKTRMGVQALYRRAFTAAKEYMATWDAWEKGGKKAPAPRRDLRLEALADILRGKIWVQCHSYRADEMLMMVRLSQEFGFKIGAMQHALEAYKIAPELAKAGVGVSMFVDNWSFKIEGYDAIPFNAAICQAAGVLVSINTDGLSGLPSLSIDASKTMRYGGLSEEQALATITINPAKQIGIDHRTGSLEVGKDADIAIWDGHPLSVYARCRMSFIEGEIYFERRDAHGVDASSTLKTKLDTNKKTSPIPVVDGMQRYAIINATIHPVSGPKIEGGTVLVEDGKIKAVGTNVAIPRDALTRVIDGAGLHVYPGFIDAGTSMGLQEISGIGQMVDTSELGGYQPDLIAATAMQPQSEHFPVSRGGGVLSVLTRPTGGTISGQGSVVNTFGWTTELMDLKSKILSINYPGAGTPFGFDPDLACCADFDLLNGEYNPWKHDHKHEDGEQHDHEPMAGMAQGGQGGGSASITELENWFNRAREYQTKKGTVPVDLTLEAMLPYVNGQAPVLLRVRSASSIRSAVAFAEKNKLKVILAGAPDAWKEAKLLADRKIPVIINPAGLSTLSANAPANDWDPYDTTFALPALLKKAGVKFAFQGENNSASFNLPVRVGQSCAFGLSTEDAIRAMTLDAAEILGVGNILGSIEPGKMGNLVISDGDPMEMTSNIVGVFVAGKPVPMESKHTRLRDQWSKRLSEK